MDTVFVTMKVASARAELDKAGMCLVAGKTEESLDSIAIAAGCLADILVPTDRLEGQLSETSALADLRAACTDAEGNMDAALVDVLKIRATLETLVEYLGSELAAEVAKMVLVPGK